MQIGKHTVVSIDYSVADAADGHVIDHSDEGDPLVYLHGVGSIIPGLESALEGKSDGDRLTATIEPSDAYGDRDESLVHVVSMEEFEGIDDLAIGMQVEAETEDGIELLTIVDMDDDTVTLDGNHILAGKTLNFEVKVVGVREATPTEIAHGHAHGPGGEHD